MPTINVKNLKDLEEAAEKIVNLSSNEKIFLFNGEMGAGKTTLIKSLCEVLGVDDAVSSPTYSIVNEYAVEKGKIFHFDFYRIKDEVEAYDLGFEEYLHSGHYCFIEWPERIKNLWPQHYVEINIAIGNSEDRLISVQHI